MQEELIKVLSVPTCNLKKLCLIQSNIKFDFLNKLLNSIQLNKSGKTISNALTNLHLINLSRNPIEDRGLNAFSNLFKDNHTSSSHSNLIDISLSKCSITSKSVNNLFNSINLYLLQNLDLSFNNLKEEPLVNLILFLKNLGKIILKKFNFQEFLKFLSEPNQLVELNLSNTDMDMDKVLLI